MSFGTNVFALILVTALFAATVTSAKSIVAKREAGLSGDVQVPGKRPFCNAFTGCGRKRSNLGPTQQAGGSTEDLMRLSQKIIGEAKLWELLQQRIFSTKGDPFETFADEQK